MLDPFKGNIKKLEMSRYIDLELYHEVEKGHPFYIEMLEEIHGILRKLLINNNKLNVLELGAGTGLLTMELLKYPHIWVDAIEYDSECCSFLYSQIKDTRCTCICEDAVTFCKENYYDCVISTFAHDHIHYDKGIDFANNIRRNLKPDGVYIMGGEIIPFYKTEEERKEALYKYHGYIINKALRDRNFRVAQIEINALKSGLDLVGDFKRHETKFEEELLSSGFSLLHKTKIGPKDVEGVGGVYVYVFRA